MEELFSDLNNTHDLLLEEFFDPLASLWNNDNSNNIDENNKNNKKDELQGIMKKSNCGEVEFNYKIQNNITKTLPEKFSSVSGLSKEEQSLFHQSYQQYFNISLFSPLSSSSSSMIDEFNNNDYNLIWPKDNKFLPQHQVVHQTHSDNPTSQIFQLQQVSEKDKKKLEKEKGKEKISSEQKRHTSKREEKQVNKCLAITTVTKLRCQNFVIMDEVNPSIYCAEHIDLDPNSIFHRCKYELFTDMKQKCKEIISKDYKCCHKHLDLWLENDFVGQDGIKKTTDLCKRTIQLVQEERKLQVKAKNTNSAIYHRKCKQIKKYKSINRSLNVHLIKLGSIYAS